VLDKPWDQLRHLYFTSYGTTSQHRFFSPGFELKEVEPHQEIGDTSRSLYVKFPPDIPTHNNVQVGGEQTFYFFKGIKHYNIPDMK
jgi:hypothetical protein